MLGLLLLGVSVTAMAHFTKRSASEGGVLAATFPAVAEWKSELGLINSKLSQIEKASNRTADASESIDRKAENFKKEVSGNPQKELANMGVPWTDEGFGQALLRNDVKVVSLYLAGGWNVTSNFGEGNAIGHFVGRGSMVEINSVEKIIDMLLEHGLSINEPVFRFRGLQATDIATAAAGGCNYQMLKIALSRGANRKNAVTAAKGYMQAPRDSPFHHECEENRKKIFKLLGIPESYQGGYITVN